MPKPSTLFSVLCNHAFCTCVHPYHFAYPLSPFLAHPMVNYTVSLFENSERHPYVTHVPIPTPTMRSTFLEWNLRFSWWWPWRLSCGMWCCALPFCWWEQVVCCCETLVSYPRRKQFSCSLSTYKFWVLHWFQILYPQFPVLCPCG